ncbi:CRISPR-associated endonuclease Cas2 [Mariniphaga sediminis]|jgi:CRISPR-associated protein Cas2|uniref:CRISPR-associated endoribonuclease Cas2 n=1 Tax=Mariniphaga sediminis TaxID=1628158 RepID=A0A399D5J2_9BACT|nr:CRISPR-associated endonuclease Cas2 [Mariniphaga sediminis]RIH67165.1 CRISPR-associated endonuclease Cas2 [Mariniphaga sediminis]
MICWVLYDIKKDRPRAKVAKKCKLAGLYRVQKSVFLGSLEDNDKDTLELEVTELIDEETDSVYIFPMSKNELRQTSLLGQAFDKKLITDEVKALFF